MPQTAALHRPPPRTVPRQPVGELLRAWRKRRGFSQLDLACEADISTRHVSFLETGRSQPSRTMLLHLAERMDIPLRDRNALLAAAGFAPVFSEHGLDDPEMRAACQAVDLVLTGHEPHPALAVDRHWTLVAANRAVAPLLTGAAPDLLQPPMNVLRLSLHPSGLAPRIENFAQWRTHILHRLTRQIDVSADPVLAALLGELKDYPLPDGQAPRSRGEPLSSHDGVLVPLRLRTEAGTLSFFSTTTVFGTAVDITLSELAIEAFFPADLATAEVMRQALSR
ncbi:helix-turn-helix transcriptional regulator [Azospirillum sp. Vi22]|uniref:helix-turn-helix domain-containing protein n=1 Tax=Azospirillum baldaniorum TaxID=1064539 RepID=UPI00157A3C52|nr:helix-turn-helix transcriptional regulator [Azospirillum baldaniorum]NUB05260.1 helix-turn-helix transcriptional regulator [Azospirillum baldaniorum]